MRSMKPSNHKPTRVPEHARTMRQPNPDERLERDHAESIRRTDCDFRPPNGQRISGERRAEGDERVRCMRVLGGPSANLTLAFSIDRLAVA